MKLAVVAAAIAAAAALTPDDLLPQMTLVQKIGQLTQLNVGMILDGNGNVDMGKLATAVGTYAVGSIINSGDAGGCSSSTPFGWTLPVWRQVLSTVQAYVVNQSQPNITPAIPLLWGLDSVHGANYVANGTMFPHSTGMAATFNPSLYYQAAIITSLDTRAAAAPWMFSPVLGVGLQPLWSRLYETFGEDPFVGAAFAHAYIRGTIDASATVGYNASIIAACMKHYMGYSAPHSGVDRTDAWIPDAYLKQYFQPAFEAAVDAGAPTAMINSGSVNGVPAHASAPLLTDILRTELNFTGVAVTDWQDIEKLQLYHSLVATPAEAIVAALAAGVDMSMVPSDYSFPTTLLALVQNGTIPESRIDASVRRVLQLKIDLGLFADPVVPAALLDYLPGTPVDQNVSLNATRASITLLANGASAATRGAPILPLTNWLPDSGRVFITGPSSVDMVALCGGWSLSWQGGAACRFQPGVGSSIHDGFVTAAAGLGLGYTVTGFQGVTFDASSAANLSTVTAMAAAADVVIMAIGEAPESETPGSIHDLTISPSQLALWQAINSTGKPVVTVLVEPRPRVLGAIADGSQAIVMAYLPCMHGGQAIAEVLLGAVNPSGKLPITYPRAVNDLQPYYAKPVDPDLEGVPATIFTDPLFEFGTGLSYSTIAYSAITLSATTVAPGEVVNVTLILTNSGPMDATETVLVFVRQLFRPAITPEVRMLKAFARFHAPINTPTAVTLTINTTDLAYWTPELTRTIDAGVYQVQVGPAGANPSTATFTITSSADLVVQPPTASSAGGSGRGRSRRLVPRPDRTFTVAAADAAAVPAPGSTVTADAALEEALAAFDELALRSSGAVARDVTREQLRTALASRLAKRQ